jgi:hypothetical protein
MAMNHNDNNNDEDTLENKRFSARQPFSNDAPLDRMSLLADALLALAEQLMEGDT